MQDAVTTRTQESMLGGDSVCLVGATCGGAEL